MSSNNFSTHIISSFVSINIRQKVKVIVLAQASKPPKSAASFLTGDTFEVGSEVILQASSRNFGYSIVKVGKLLEASDPFPAGVKSRQIGDLVSAAVAPSDTKGAGAATFLQPQPLPSSAVVITTSRVEAAECTRVDVAVQALLRAANHPCANATFSVLSSAVDGPPEDVQWDDEFVKIIGSYLVIYIHLDASR